MSSNEKYSTICLFFTIEEIDRNEDESEFASN